MICNTHLAAHVGHTGQCLELVEVWFFTAAPPAAVQVLGTVALCLALMDLKLLKGCHILYSIQLILLVTYIVSLHHTHVL